MAASIAPTDLLDWSHAAVAIAWDLMLLALYGFVAAVFARALVRFFNFVRKGEPLVPKPKLDAKAVTHWQCSRCRYVFKTVDLPATCDQDPCPMEPVA